MTYCYLHFHQILCGRTAPAILSTLNHNGTTASVITKIIISWSSMHHNKLRSSTVLITVQMATISELIITNRMGGQADNRSDAAAHAVLRWMLSDDSIPLLMMYTTLLWPTTVDATWHAITAFLPRIFNNSLATTYMWTNSNKCYLNIFGKILFCLK